MTCLRLETVECEKVILLLYCVSVTLSIFQWILAQFLFVTLESSIVPIPTARVNICVMSYLEYPIAINCSYMFCSNFS